MSRYEVEDTYDYGMSDKRRCELQDLARAHFAIIGLSEEDILSSPDDYIAKLNKVRIDYFGEPRQVYPPEGYILGQLALDISSNKEE